jgi:hypothetical protein
LPASTAKANGRAGSEDPARPFQRNAARTTGYFLQRRANMLRPRVSLRVNLLTDDRDPQDGNEQGTTR